jgi:beta-lactamase regulating signal transducer with metallopeptidase domain
MSVFNLIPNLKVKGIEGQSDINKAVSPVAYIDADTLVTMPAGFPEIMESGPKIEVRSKPTERLVLGAAEILSLVWLGGAFVLGVYVLAGNFSLWRIVKRQRPLTEQKVLDLLEDCKQQMGVQTVLSVVVTGRIKSPALFGFVRPRLLLPEGIIESLRDEELRNVFLHELAHLKRHDIGFGWLIAVCQVIHWFNPLVWYGFHRMRIDRELACDALALSRGQADKYCEYGQTIVHLLEKFSQPQRLPGLAGILEDKSQLKRRITMIARFKKGSYRWSALAVVLLAVLGCVVLTNAQDVSRAERKKTQISQFTARLRSGVTVELVGVCEHPSEGKQWWRPDGGLLGKSLYKTTGSRLPDHENYRYYEFAACLRGPSGARIKWDVPGRKQGSYTGSPIDYNEERVADLLVYTVNQPEEKEAALVRIGIAASEWETVVTHSLKKEGTYDTDDGAVSFGVPYEKDNVIYLPVTHTRDTFRKRAIRVFAIDHKGNDYTGSVSGYGGNVLSSQTYEFRLPLENIKEFQFRTRPYEWVDFKNVSLRPEIKTDVVVVDKVAQKKAGVSKPDGSKPNIFIMNPSGYPGPRVHIFQEVTWILKDVVSNRTGRSHEKKSYDGLFDGTHNRKGGDLLVLVFSLDSKGRIPSEYEDLLPRPWPEIEAQLKQGETVELEGKARDLNVIFLAAPKSSQFKQLIRHSKLLNALALQAFLKESNVQ